MSAAGLNLQRYEKTTQYCIHTLTGTKINKMNIFKDTVDDAIFLDL